MSAPKPGDVIFDVTQPGASREQLAAFSAGTEDPNPIHVDDAFAMRPGLLAAADDEDRAAGRVQCLVMATIGTTSSLAVDPVDRIAPVAEAAGISRRTFFNYFPSQAEAEQAQAAYEARGYSPVGVAQVTMNCID